MVEEVVPSTVEVVQQPEEALELIFEARFDDLPIVEGASAKVARKRGSMRAKVSWASLRTSMTIPTPAPTCA